MAPVKKIVKEAPDGHVSFLFRGQEIVVPIGEDMPSAALEAFENDKLVTFIRLLLGPDQYKKVKSDLKTVKDVVELGNALTEAMGTTVGE